MTLTQSQVNALSEGGAGDVLVSQYAGWRVPYPTISLDTAHQLEGEIKRLGLCEQYADELKKIVKKDDPEDLDTQFLIANATALQRCKAFLMLHVG